MADPSFDAGPNRVTIRGEEALAKALAAAPAAMKRELRKSHRGVAKKAQGWTRAAAAAGTPQQRRAANAIKASATSTAARLDIKPGVKTQGALGTFYGAKQYRQFPEWVGSSWKPATQGEGPQPINDALAKHEMDIITEFEAGQWRALHAVTSVQK